jgi:hypothetical protein
MVYGHLFEKAFGEQKSTVNKGTLFPLILDKTSVAIGKRIPAFQAFL